MLVVRLRRTAVSFRSVKWLCAGSLVDPPPGMMAAEGLLLLQVCAERAASSARATIDDHFDPRVKGVIC